MIDALSHVRQPSIVCPHCGHAMTDDEMCSNSYLDGSDGDDLYGIAPNEERTHVVCPSALCGKGYYVQGHYLPQYTTAIDEDDL
ncbi:hypothetical protein G3O00_01600 [Burkholderia sp. Ac-20384]|uniref:hypothetical protein n=1 Tax=Burkholderia sp. Ac-20384 TaxID=2703902 RepID=UPI0019805BA3|nr:hypothetical protein [Burkholderia sp. Ac-20384]MBN3822313.1 hypothetical protein [Burkholderia sp. Ac-20384]